MPPRNSRLVGYGSPLWGQQETALLAAAVTNCFICIITKKKKPRLCYINHLSRN